MSTFNRLRFEPLEARDVPAGNVAYAIGLTGVPVGTQLRTVVDSANNTYVAGSFSGTLDLDPTAAGTFNVTSNGGTDVFAAKYSPSGQLVWGKSLGGTSDDTAADIALDGASNVYIGGTFVGRADFDPKPLVTRNLTASASGSAFVWKLTATGDLYLGRAVSGASTLASIAITPRGDINAVGKFTGTADFDPSANVANQTTTNPGGAGYVWRLDPFGSYAWSGAFNSTRGIDLGAVAVDQIGSVFIGGRVGGVGDINPMSGTSVVNAGYNWTPFITKLSSIGAFQWSRTAPVLAAVTNAPNQITGLAVDGYGSVIAAGSFAGTLDFDQSPAVFAVMSSAGKSVDVFNWKLDTTGKLAWFRGIGSGYNDSATDLYADQLGNVYTIGTFTGVMDVDPSFGITNLVAGSGNYDTFLVKLNAKGGLMYGRSLGGGSSTTRGSGVFADSVGNITMTGTFSGKADFDPSDAVAAIDGGPGSAFIARITPLPGSSVGPTNTTPRIVSTGGPYVIKEGQGITLAARASDSGFGALSYTWDLNGDGNFGDAVGPNATVGPVRLAALGLAASSATPFAVRLRVSDGVNLPIESVTTLTIQNVAPTVQVVAPAIVSQGNTPLVQATASGDPSAADRQAGFRFSYDFNNDGVWDIGDGATYVGSVTQTSAVVPKEYTSAAGRLTVKVRVFDQDGGYSDGTAVIQVANNAPTATFGLVGLPRIGQPTFFQFTNPKDSEADIDAGLTYGFDFNNDGYYEYLSANPRQSFVFSFPGTYTVRGMVKDVSGGFTEYSLTMSIQS